MRKWFKERKLNAKLEKFGKDNGADYIEKEDEEVIVVWMIPRKWGTTRLAVALQSDGRFQIGEINEGCMNFESCNRNVSYSKEEAKWLIEILTKIIKFK